MKTVAIIGSRGFPRDSADYFLSSKLSAVGGVERVVSGGAPGPDRFGEEMALARGLSVLSYRPRRAGSVFVVHRWIDGTDCGPVSRYSLVLDADSFEAAPEHDYVLTYKTFGEAAKARNWWIVRDADEVVAFWDGVSGGTAHAIAAAARLNRPIRIHMAGDS